MALMRGLELSIPGAAIADKARDKGLIINCTQEKVLRIMPALTVTRPMIKKALRILEEVLKDFK